MRAGFSYSQGQDLDDIRANLSPLHPSRILLAGQTETFVVELDAELRDLEYALRHYLVTIRPLAEDILQEVFRSFDGHGDWELALSDAMSELIAEATGSPHEADFHRLASIVLDFGRRVGDKLGLMLGFTGMPVGYHLSHLKHRTIVLIRHAQGCGNG